MYTKGTLEERFWARVRKGSDCWGWRRGGKHPRGYGRISLGEEDGWKMDLAHRVSWRIHFGCIPEGMCVLHKCDNRECTNPEHLFLGTIADNQADMVQKGRQAIGKKNGATKLTENDVINIRILDIPARAIANIYGICNQNVSMIKLRRTWKHVQ